MNDHSNEICQSEDVWGSVTTEILEIVSDNIDNENKKVESYRKLRDLEIDSIAFIKIISSIEIKYNFEFEDDKLSLKYFPTVIALVDYVINNKKDE